MTENEQTSKEFTRLPGEWIDGLVKPIVHFLDIESAGGAILLLFTVAALVLSNSPWSDTYFNVWETRVGLHHGPVTPAVRRIV